RRGQVVAHGPRAEVGALGDLLDRRAVDGELEHVGLSWGQRRVARTDRLGGELGVDVAAARPYLPDDVGEHAAGHGLRDEGRDARLERPLEVPRPAVARDDDRAAAGDVGGELLGHGDPVEAGHLEGEDGDVGPVVPAGGHRLRPGGGLRDDLDVLLEPEEPGEGVADEVLVVGEEDADHGASIVSGAGCSAAARGTRARRVNVPPRASVVSVPPSVPSRSERPRSPEPDDGPPVAPSLTMVSWATGPSSPSSTARSIVHVAADECRTTFVAASRTTHARADWTRGGRVVSSPMTRVRTPAERSIERAPATSVARSAWR